MKYIVTCQEHGWTLLAFLQEKGKGVYSVRFLKKAIADKACRVGGKVELFPSRKLFEGEEVELDPVDLVFQEKTVSIIFEDEHFAFVNKSPGILSSVEEFRRSLGVHAKKWVLAHRLDKDTSGVVLLAKNDRAEEEAKKLFACRSIHKLYLAIVDGRVMPSKGVIDNFLGKKGGYQGQTLYGSVSEKEGQRAITHYQVIAQGQTSALVLCDLKTGRTHQIRVHFSELSHPILGDDQYAKGAFSCPFHPKRHLLHAWKLIFTHPFTKQPIQVQAPLPADFKQALQKLGIKHERI